MNGIRTITLDLDDTLWDVGPVIRRAESCLRDWLDRNYPRITARFGPDEVRAVREEVMRDHGDRTHDLSFLRRTVLKRMADAAGYAAFPVDEAFDVFDVARNEVTLFPEALPTLEALRRRYVLVAVTNGNADLDRIGIRELFDGVVSAASAGAAKPARRIFEVAVAAGGAGVDATVHVGDHPHHDVHGAREAGLRAVWVNRRAEPWPGEFPEPDAEVRHVGELCALMGVAGS